MKSAKPNWRWSRRNSLIVTLPLAAITALYMWQVYLPLRRTIADLRQQCERMEFMVMQAQKLSGSVHPLKRDLERTQAYAAQHVTRMSSQEDARAMLGDIAVLADEAGARMERLEPAAVESMTYLVRVPVSLTCQGEFTELYDFLYRLETLPRRVWIEELRVESPREAGQDARCEMKVVVFAKRSENSD